MSNSHIFEEGKFFGCYLLCSTNPKYKGRTYIGFTVNPNRRINQHNSGYAKGGAKRTSGKGPWDMVLIIHGFPNEISALRFEWAWQNPEKSLRLKHLVPTTKQYNFISKFNVVCEMLRLGPWCRLPLTIRWLRQEYKKEFPLNKLPPAHMPVEFGLVQIVPKSKSKKLLAIENEQIHMSQVQSVSDVCFICKVNILESSQDVLNKNLASLKCINCMVPYHAICLSNNFIVLTGSELLPVDGDCLKCRVHLMWGDLVKFRRNFYRMTNFAEGETHFEDDDYEEEESFVENDQEDENEEAIDT
ncbi:structure-specific endonuclease subunit slx1-like [Brachionus plicatilis]|uniref:Structure-specific endonuclease subunit SLX1 homolog n=1 Tax=Brachionus plicatilis TaxID=10195 RepID=A0A3M7RM67_BRAPC|nr:structure-specific endonuclease subunit slx1-like [Brachionus plicatilis]